MNDREAILARIAPVALHKVRHPGAHPAPALEDGWPAFAARLASVGGAAHGPVARDALPREMARVVSERAPGERVVAEPTAASLLPAARLETVDTAALPHSLADVAVGVATGHVACAENGAVAVLGTDAPHRSLLVLCRHLVLLVEAAAVVPDLHTAFAALPSDALEHHHLTWISGPSKTADIELSLVYGAHGPLTLDVIGIGR